MKTYSCHYASGGEPLFEKKRPSDLFNLIPAGAKLIGGDGSDKKTGLPISKAIYLLPNGIKIILTEDKC